MCRCFERQGLHSVDKSMSSMSGVGKFNTGVVRSLRNSKSSVGKSKSCKSSVGKSDTGDECCAGSLAILLFGS